jgi:hypothetical protein
MGKGEGNGETPNREAQGSESLKELQGYKGDGNNRDGGRKRNAQLPTPNAQLGIGESSTSMSTSTITSEAKKGLTPNPPTVGFAVANVQRPTPKWGEKGYGESLKELQGYKGDGNNRDGGRKRNAQRPTPKAFASKASKCEEENRARA